ncbi:MAG: cell wall-active antibiotics response protein [Bacteroidetes bacterium]|nr:cell wall-active antibiotics response protein [Bacteroidota bacterium]MBU1116217.1 cell wall-active antibiotics response protein [Bacteroidota bacterium]MBU1798585.1 cell wall-active antibiotics response protein [Bacteroidota bacterium]
MEPKFKPNTIVGVIVILVGSLFLLKNFGLFPYEFWELIFRWQTFLILIGTIIYFNSNKSVGLTLVVIGGLCWVPDIWPILLIALGAYVIFRNKKISLNSEKMHEYNPNEMINDVSIFGGATKSIQIDNFRGGNLTAIFGGSEIDLMDSNLAEGINRLEIFFMFGGTNMKVPSNWNVKIEITPIFGSFKDKRIIQQNQVFDDSKTLIITGITIFGGGELKNYIKF